MSSTLTNPGNNSSHIALVNNNINQERVERNDIKKRWTTISTLNDNNGEDMIDEVKGKEFYHSKLYGILLYIGLSLFILFLIFLSFVYGFGQLYSISLSNFWCEKRYESFTIDDIYQINRENGRAEGSPYTCLATDAIADYDKLFAIDPSIAYSSLFDENNTARNYIFFTFYQLVAVTLLLIVISPLTTLCAACNLCNSCDCNKKTTTTGQLTQPLLGNGNSVEKKKILYNKKHNKQCSQIIATFVQKMKLLKGWWNRLTAVDTGSWIALKLISETLEIGAQILVLFYYGGTSLTEIMFNDDDDTSQLSQLPHYVIAFGVIIMANGLITGIFWILYSIFPSKIYGYSYNDMLFVCDGIFDSIYSIFPFIIAGAFTNDSKNNFINKIGILQHDSWISFIGAGFPLVLLVKKSHSATKRVKKIVSGRHIGDEYATYASDIELYRTTQTCDSAMAYSQLDKQLSHGEVACITTDKGRVIEKQLFINHRNLIERQMSDEFVEKTHRMSVKQRHDNRKIINNVKRLFLGLFGLIIIVGVSTFVGLSAVIDAYNAQSYCSSFTINNYHSATENNHHELLVYKTNCQTKVYKLFADYPCDCRFFQITSEETGDGNSTLCNVINAQLVDAGEIITKVFSEWKMLERIDIRSGGVASACLSSYTLNITDNSFFNSKHLQALVLHNAQFSFDITLDVELFDNDQFLWNNTDDSYDNKEAEIVNKTGKFLIESMKNWQNILFLNFEFVDFNGYEYDFSLGIGYHMQNIIYLSIDRWDIKKWPPTWCNIDKNIQYFEVSTHGIDMVDNCLKSFKQLKYFKLWKGAATYLPFASLFNLPHISIIALNLEDISWDTLVSSFYRYDARSNESEFSGYNHNTLSEVYFQVNPFCDVYTMYSDDFGELVTMIDNFTACQVSCRFEEYEYACPSFQVANGVCDPFCNGDHCWYDGGDCNQLCNNSKCFYDLRNGCDAICNSSECGWDGNDCIVDRIECPNNGLCPNWIIGDSVCHLGCLNESFPDCYEYEYYHDCQSCVDGSLCQFVVQYFHQFVGYSDDNDNREVVTMSDCIEISSNDGLWKEASDVIYGKFDVNLTCEIMMNKTDYNENGVLGLWEFVLLGEELIAPTDQISPFVDCSMCMNNASQYYL